MGISHFENQALKRYHISNATTVCFFNRSAKRVHLSFIVRISSQLPKQCKLHILITFLLVTSYSWLGFSVVCICLAMFGFVLFFFWFWWLVCFEDLLFVCGLFLVFWGGWWCFIMRSVPYQSGWCSK